MARSQLQKLGTYLRPHWLATARGIYALFLVNLLAVLMPLLIRDGIGALRQAHYDQVWRDSLWVLGLATVMWFIRMTSRTLLFGVGRQVEFDLKQKIFNHLLDLDPAYFAANTVGDLINRATSDVENVRRLLGFAILSLANTLFVYVMILPTMFWINLRLSLVAVAVYPFMLLLVSLFSNQLRNQQMRVQEELSKLSELIQEDMSGIALIKIYAQEATERGAFRQLNQRLLEANLKLARTRNILFPVLQGVTAVGTLLLLWLGSSALESGALSVENFIALILYVGQLAFPTALLGFTITAYQRGEVSIDRIEAILSVEPAIQTAAHAAAIPPEQFQGQLMAKGLTFAYPGSPIPALDQVNFTIEPGEMVSIVGPIGSGKSTLANALPRLLDIQSGQLFLDGHDITTLRLPDLRGAIAYVPQDSFLFSLSIEDNIRYSNPFADEYAVQLAAKQAQIDGEIQNFPQHYATIVGERGITLSGGQRQRTALARALLVDAPILILDDALSSVDNQTATQILRNLSSEGAGTLGRRQTVVFISHQMSAAASADRIIVMDGGRIVQTGTHAELLLQPGLYNQLWQQQKLAAVLD
jgi:ATP-binding cassette, subfamily B, multidrug efflux pump